MNLLRFKTDIFNNLVLFIRFNGLFYLSSCISWLIYYEFITTNTATYALVVIIYWAFLVTPLSSLIAYMLYLAGINRAAIKYWIEPLLLGILSVYLSVSELPFIQQWANLFITNYSNLVAQVSHIPVSIVIILVLQGVITGLYKRLRHRDKRPVNRDIRRLQRAYRIESIKTGAAYLIAMLVFYYTFIGILYVILLWLGYHG